MLGLRPRLRTRSSLFDLIGRHNADQQPNTPSWEHLEEDVDDLPPLPITPGPGEVLYSPFGPPTPYTLCDTIQEDRLGAEAEFEYSSSEAEEDINLTAPTKPVMAPVSSSSSCITVSQQLITHCSPTLPGLVRKLERNNMVFCARQSLQGIY